MRYFSLKVFQLLAMKFFLLRKYFHNLTLNQLIENSFQVSENRENKKFIRIFGVGAMPRISLYIGKIMMLKEEVFGGIFKWTEGKECWRNIYELPCNCCKNSFYRFYASLMFPVSNDFSSLLKFYFSKEKDIKFFRENFSVWSVPNQKVRPVKDVKKDNEGQCLISMLS